MSENFQFFGETVLALPKLVCPRHTFKRKIYNKKKTNFSHYFLTSQKIPELAERKYQNRDQKNCSTKVFLGERYKFITFYGFSDENLTFKKTQVRQRGILAVQRNIPRKKFLQERNLFLTYGLWTRIYSVSGNRKLTELPKLHSICPEIGFQKKDFFPNKT